MALTSQRTMSKEDEETVRKLEPHVKMAKTFTVRGKTYTSEQFKHLTDTKKNRLLKIWDGIDIWKF